jgi:hypothetical protein
MELVLGLRGREGQGDCARPLMKEGRTAHEDDGEGGCEKEATPVRLEPPLSLSEGQVAETLDLLLGAVERGAGRDLAHPCLGELRSEDVQDLQPGREPHQGCYTV